MSDDLSSQPVPTEPGRQVLPNVVAASSVSAAPTGSSAISAATSSSRSNDPGRRVLVIEDHADTAVMMQRILRADGHIVDIANSLAAAEARCSNGRYDLLITDLELPDGLAFDLIAPGRSAHGVPAIVISGHGMPSHIDRSRQAGFREHLVKPFSIMQLREAIARVLG